MRVVNPLLDFVHIGGAEGCAVRVYRAGDVVQNDRSGCFLGLLKPVEVGDFPDFPFCFLVHKASISGATGSYHKGDKLT